jgi:hypothetical protein
MDNIANVHLVFVLPDGQVDAGQEGQDRARFFSRTQPKNGASRAPFPP